MSTWSDLEKTLFNASEMYYRRRDALIKMARLDKARVADALAAVAGDPEKVLRREAAKLLMDCQPQKARPLLVKLVSDDDSDVRRFALASLAKVGDPSCADAVRPLLEDKNYFVKREAEKALEAMGAREPAPAVAPEPPKAAPPPPKVAKEPIEPPPALEEPVATLPLWEPKKAAPPPAPEEPVFTLPPWKQKEAKQEEKAPPKAKRSLSAPGKASDTEERLPPWKRKGAPVLSSSAPSVDDADIKAQVLKLKKKREEHRERKRSRRKPRHRPDHARPASKAKAQTSKKAPPKAKADPYKIYIPVAKIDGTVRRPTQPTDVRKPTARGDAASGPSKLCPKCKWVLKPNQRYCNFCGAPITPASASAGPSSPPPPRYTPKYGSQPAVSFTRRPQTRTAGKGCTAAAILAVIVGVGVLGIFFTLFSTRSEKAAQRTAKAEAKVNKAKADLARVEADAEHLKRKARTRKAFQRILAKDRRRKAGRLPMGRDSEIEASRAPMGRVQKGAPGRISLKSRARVTMVSGEVFEGTIVQDTGKFFRIKVSDGREFLQRKTQVRFFKYLKK